SPPRSLSRDVSMGFDTSIAEIEESEGGSIFEDDDRADAIAKAKQQQEQGIRHESNFMMKFESIKRIFKGQHRESQLPLLMNHEGASNYEQGLRETNRLQAMFDKVIIRPFELVSKQIKRTKEENTNPVSV
ncbi:MAG TPA: hypothetical protein VE971_04765, partial [Candidatus Eisenbacteria bacterium]|nr:hypothetical protein [Candidatus Eisenbacteria bacterium]